MRSRFPNPRCKVFPPASNVQEPWSFFQAREWVTATNSDPVNLSRFLATLQSSSPHVPLYWLQALASEHNADTEQQHRENRLQYYIERNVDLGV